MTVNTALVISDNTIPGSRPNQNSLDPNVAVDNPGGLYVYEPDTNRLARGVSSGTVIERRDTERRRNIPTGLSIDQWDEPESSFGAMYPHNRVTETPNGLVEEMDDTPGNQRFHRYHPSGSYDETNASGSVVRKIVGDSFEIIENNGYIFIKGRASVTIENSCNILILGDANLEVNGKLTALVKNDISLTSSGSMNLNVGENLSIKAEDIVIESTKFNQTTVGAQKIKTGSLSQEIENNSDVKIGGEQKIQSNSIDITSSTNTKIKTENFDVNASGSNKQSAEGDMSLKSSGSFKASGEASASLGSSGDTKLGGGVVHINGSLKATTTDKETIGNNLYPVSTAGPSAPDAPETAENATEPTIESPQNTNLTRVPLRSSSATVSSPNIPLPNSRSQRIAIENDGREQRPTQSLYPGFSSPSVYVPTLTAPAVGSIPIIDPTPINPRFQNITTAPYEQLISKYVRLKDVSSIARARGHLIPDSGWEGLSLGQIVTNLQALSENVIDKIIEKYGTSVILTSGFRQERGSTSQHARGQAVDIQFQGLSPTDYQPRYLEIMRDIPFDQFLLEYQSGGSGNPWMHISFNIQGNRRQYFTMRNHSRITPVYTL